MNSIGAEKEKKSALLEWEGIGGGGSRLNMFPAFVDHPDLLPGDSARIKIADKVAPGGVGNGNEDIGVSDRETGHQCEIEPSRESAARSPLSYDRRPFER